jgi:hypothetical protein
MIREKLHDYRRNLRRIKMSQGMDERRDRRIFGGIVERTVRAARFSGAGATIEASDLFDRRLLLPEYRQPIGSSTIVKDRTRLGQRNLWQ